MTVTEDEHMAYLAFRPQCGCFVGVTVDQPENTERVANDVAGWIRAGYHIERRTVEEVRAMDWKVCKCP